MRIVEKYIDGKPVYRDLGPANGASGPSRPSGSLVQALPDWKARRSPVNPPLTANQTRADRPAKPGRPAKPKLPQPPKARSAIPPVPQPKGWAYPSEEERIAARRQSWRESARRRREKAA